MFPWGLPRPPAGRAAVQGQTWRSSGKMAGDGKQRGTRKKGGDHGICKRGKGGVQKQQETGQWKDQQNMPALETENAELLSGAGKAPSQQQPRRQGRR